MSLLTDSLSEYSYNAEVAGLNYYLNQDTKGITVSLFNTTKKGIIKTKKPKVTCGWV